MFNTTVDNSKSEVVAVTKVVEKTITPDKVTDMYDKVREEVENTILRAYKVDDNDLHGIVFQVDYATRQLWTRFTLNGREHITKKITDQLVILTPIQAYEYLKKEYAEVVAVELVKEAALTRKII